MGDWYEIGVALGLGRRRGPVARGTRRGLEVRAARVDRRRAGDRRRRRSPRQGLDRAARVRSSARVIGAVSASIVARGALRRGATTGGTAFLVGTRLDRGRVARADAGRRLPARGGHARGRGAPRAQRARAPRRAPHAREVSGERPQPAEARPRRDRRPDAVDARGRRSARRPLPTLTALAERGTLGRATTTFPSLTPVCLSSIATGAHPDVHEIPHLVWWHRRERRLVEYGSSFGAARAAGLGRTLRDTLVGMNAEHLGQRAVTVFEALADAGLATAAVNFTAYRGRTLHRAAVPFLGTVRGPERFYFYNLFRVGADGCAALVPQPRGGHHRRVRRRRRPLARDPGRLRLPPLLPLRLRLRVARRRARTPPPTCSRGATRRSAGSSRAAGGLDEFLERYAVVVMSDHGQTAVTDVARLGEPVPERAGDARRGLQPGRAALPARHRGPVGARARRAARRRAVGRGRALPRGRRRRRAA